MENDQLEVAGLRFYLVFRVAIPGLKMKGPVFRFEFPATVCINTL